MKQGIQPVYLGQVHLFISLHALSRACLSSLFTVYWVFSALRVRT